MPKLFRINKPVVTPAVIKGTAYAGNLALQESFPDDERSEPAADAGKFRRLTGGRRDLAPLKYRQLVEMSFYLWQRNPFARRIIEIMKDFCVGDEISVNVRIMRSMPDGTSEDTKKLDAQDVWDDFAEDPQNKFMEEMDDVVTDLFVNGELAILTAVNPQSGSVIIGYADPLNIVEVVHDPLNVRDVKQVIFTPLGSTEQVPKTVARIDMVPTSPTYGKLVGELLFFRMNKLVNQTRGFPLLAELTDWLDALDQFLFDALEGFVLRNNFCYDVTMTGADEKTMKGKTLSPPKSGSVKIHNEMVKWDVITPDLKSIDVSEAMRLVKNFILGGKGYPEYWFAEGGRTNLATAEAMGIPTMRMLKSKQRTIKSLIKMVAQYVVDQSKLFKLQSGEFIDIQVTAFDFERKDASVIATAFAQSMTGLVVAAGKNWVSDENAKKVVDGLLQRLGIEVDVNETTEQIAQAKKDANPDGAMPGDSQSVQDLMSKIPANKFFTQAGGGQQQ